MDNTNPEITTDDFGPTYEVGDKSNPKLQNKTGFDKNKAVAYLERRCSKLVQAAEEAGQWDWICKQSLPTVYAEQFAMFLAIKDTDTVKKYASVEEAVLATIRRVKRHLIYRNMSLLEAFEKSMLGDMVAFCQKQDAVKPISKHNTERTFVAEEKVG